MAELGIWIAYNEDGDWCCHDSAEEASEALSETYGGAVVAVFKINATAPDLSIPELEITVPESAVEISAEVETPAEGESAVS